MIAPLFLFTLELLVSGVAPAEVCAEPERTAAVSRPPEVAATVLEPPYLRTEAGPFAFVYRQEDTLAAQRLIDYVPALTVRSHQVLARGLEQPLTVVLVADRGDLGRLLVPLNAEPAGTEAADALVPDEALEAVGARALLPWMAALAVPHENLIVLRSPRFGGSNSRDLRVALSHETLHILLGQVSHRRLPRWFDEGLAQWMAGEWSLTQVGRLTRLSLTGGLWSIEELSGSFGTDEQRARDGYAQAYSLMQTLVAHYGRGSLRGILARFERGADFGSAFRQTTGADLDELERHWHDAVLRSYLSVPLLLGGSALWFAIGVLLVGAFRTKRRQCQKRLVMMRIEEEIEEIFAESTDSRR